MPLTLNSLGCASAVPTKDHFFTAHVLNVRGRFILLDCGEATQLRIRQEGFSLGSIDYVLITHLHGDHCFGIPGLFSTMHLLGRIKPLHIVAPADFSFIMDYYFTHHCDRTPSFEVIFHPVQAAASSLDIPFEVLQNEYFSVTALPLRHSLTSFGYLIRERKLRSCRQRSVAYCTDTAYFPELAQWVKGVDLLFHEATFLNEDHANAEKYGHSTPSEAARVALDAGVGKLVIGHFSQKIKDMNQVLEQARAVFPETYLSLEGCSFDVPRIT